MNGLFGLIYVPVQVEGTKQRKLNVNEVGNRNQEMICRNKKFLMVGFDSGIWGGMGMGMGIGIGVEG